MTGSLRVVDLRDEKERRIDVQSVGLAAAVAADADRGRVHRLGARAAGLPGLLRGAERVMKEMGMVREAPGA